LESERWRRIEEIFLQAVEQEAGARLRFLDEQCGDDRELRGEVERLLAADGRAAERLASAVGGALRSFHNPAPPGTRLGAYEIVDRIGEGGMGIVYRARRSDAVFEKEVAIKVLKRVSSETELRRFQRERRILAQLEHPGIARILDGGSTDDGLPYLVMEYIEGRTLLEYADEHRLDLQARLRVFLQVCDAVESAHQSQIVHRDLKPNNIMVDAHGRPRLLDFGIAKLLGTSEDAITLTAGGAGMLTPRYASPEQLNAEPVTPASDVYSLGIILYELITGSTVHRIGNGSPATIVRVVCDEPVPSLSQAAQAARDAGRSTPVSPEELKGDLNSVVLTALERDPQRRYATVQALADDLRRYTEALPVAARRQTLTSRAVRLAGRRRAPLVASSVAALFAFVLVAGYFLRASDRTPAPSPAGKIMLAVLPLENLTGGDEQQQLFVDGLHEEIISRLGRLQPDRLGVIARTSVLQYERTRKPIGEIGKELGAQYILEGSVRQTGQLVRVTAQFIQVSDQTHLWTETFEREFRDLLSVQADIGGHVADSLQVEVLPSARAVVDRHEQLSADAYAAYLRGRYYWQRRWMDYPANAGRALDRFEAVVAAAPTYAEGHAALGQTYHYLSTYPATRERQLLLHKARAALAQALALDAGLASAHATQAWIAFRNDWDFAGGERGLREALRLDPNDADIHQQMATLLAYTGRHLEADREIRLAQELDPLSLTLHVSAFYVHLSGRRYEKADAVVRKLADLVPGSSMPTYFASLLLTLRGDCPRALDELAKVKTAPDEPEAGTLGEEHNEGFVLGRCGRPEAARRLARVLEKQPEYLAQRFAVIYAGLDDRNRALGWLEESLRRHEDVLTGIAMDPRLDNLHSEPRFQQLLTRMGFPKP
jgi:eukaryotic-like serine/threonine-protein kinase